MYRLTEYEGYIEKISTGVVFSNRGSVGKKMWLDFESWASKGNAPSPIKLEALADKKARLMEDLRAQRDHLIQSQIGTIDRHRRQIEMNRSTDLTDTEYKELLTKIQYLCDMPAIHTTLAKLENPTWPTL